MKVHTVYKIMSGAEIIYIGCTSKDPHERLSALKRSFNDHTGPFAVHVLGQYVDAVDASQFEQEQYAKHKPYYNGASRTAKYRHVGKPTSYSVLFRFETVAARSRIHAEAKARKWSLQTYITHLITTHQERQKPLKRVQDTDTD